MRIERLEPGQEAELRAFLGRGPDTNLFLRSNLQRAGLSFSGGPLEAEYFATRDEEGRLRGVVAHAWNGNLLLDAREALGDLFPALGTRLQRPVLGLLGPWEEAVVARRTLGLEGRGTRLDAREALMAVDLPQLCVPPPLQRGDLVCRRSRPQDLALLTAWHVAYGLETLGERPGPALEQGCRRDVERGHGLGHLWVLEADAAPVSTSGFNAALPEVVQIGGVYTPPRLRNRGYARAVVAGSLLEARGKGTARSVLFTNSQAARRSYASLGFERLGDFALILFAE